MEGWEEAVETFGPFIMSLFSNQGSSQAQEEALKRMMQIATGQYNMQAKQANMDLPFRQDLFGALRNREATKAPRIMPGSFQASNPYENLRRVGPTNPSQLSKALMGQGTPALQGPRGTSYQPPAPIRNPLMPQQGTPG